MATEKSPQLSGPAVDRSLGPDAPQPAVDGRAPTIRLREALEGLSRLTIQSGLPQLLTRIAELAVQAVPNADGAGLALHEDDRTDTIVSTSEIIRDVDEIQYSIGRGPCIVAARDGRTVMSGSLGADPRWPRFGGSVARLGVHSVLSLPLTTPDGAVGAINVYARAKHAFGERAAEIGETFAIPAATLAQNARTLAQSQRLAARLQLALETRGVIAQAIGITMSRSGCTEHEALAQLRTASNKNNKKMVDIARRIVDEADRLARGRRT